MTRQVVSSSGPLKQIYGCSHGARWGAGPGRSSHNRSVPSVFWQLHHLGPAPELHGGAEVFARGTMRFPCPLEGRLGPSHHELQR